MLTMILRIILIVMYALLLIAVYGLCIFTVPGLLMFAKRLRRWWIFLLSSIVSAALFLLCTQYLTHHPRIIIPDDLTPYVTEERLDTIRDSLCFANPLALAIPIRIRVVSASETHYAAEARYSGFGGTLGMARNFRDGKWYGELYEP